LPVSGAYVDIGVGTRSNFLGACGAAGRFGKEVTFPKIIN